MNTPLEDLLRTKVKKVPRVKMEPLVVLYIEEVGFTGESSLEKANRFWSTLQPEDLPRISISSPNKPLALDSDREIDNQDINRILITAAKKHLRTN